MESDKSQNRVWDKKQITLGILGLGVVGSGTVRLLMENAAEIERKIGLPIVIKKIAVRNLDKPRDVVVDRALLTNDPCEVIDDPDIDIVCELIGGVEPARGYVLRALKNGKQIVTANKEMIAKEGQSLMEEASRRGLDLQFEGSVAGGIPIIQPMKNALAGNRIEQVMGIINGTTNYILTKMTREGADFGEVLKEAQAHGYAETDPTSDIEGFDGQEIATAFHHGVAPIVLLFNNSMYGTIRMYQERAFPGRVSGSSLTNPDFVRFIEAFGGHGELVTATGEFAPAFRRAVAAGRPALIELRTDPEQITTRATIAGLRAAAGMPGAESKPPVVRPTVAARGPAKQRPKR